jgi:hypothetical protein
MDLKKEEKYPVIVEYSGNKWQNSQGTVDECDLGYTGSDRSSAATRLKRLGNRPQFISQEKSVDPTKTYLKKAFPSGNFTFLALPFADHTDQWVLRDMPERKVLREWFENALTEKGQPQR